LSDPHRPILDVSASRRRRQRCPRAKRPSRSHRRGHPQGSRGHRRHLESRSARGEKAWGRITGFRAADDTHAWVLQQFKAAGLRDAETQTYTATQPTWYPKNWS
jgi:hypothetical protein